MTDWKEEALRGLPITGVAFSPDNATVALSSGNQLITHPIDQPNDRTIVQCSDNIVSLIFLSPKELCTVTFRGQMTVWAVSNGSLDEQSARRVTAFNIIQILWSSDGRESVWRLVDDGRKKTHLLCHMSADQNMKTIVRVPKTLETQKIAFGNGFVVYCEENELKMYSLDGVHKEKKHSFVYNSNLHETKENLNLFVRVSALGNIIAASTANGRVLIWENVTVSKGIKLSAAHSLHWHKVSAPMVLTPYGGLLSAGAEAVLCKWVLSGAGAPSQLPRLSAPVSNLYLAPDASMVALLLEDNTVHVVLVSSMSVLCSLPCITWCQRSPQNIFTIDPRCKMVVLNGKPGSIQWLNPSEHSTKEMMNFSLENPVDGDMSLVGIINTYHELMAVSLCTNYAASIEALVNFDQDHRRIRFWQRCNENAYSMTVQDTFAVSKDTKFLSGVAAPTCDEEKVFITCSRSGTISVWQQWQEGAHWRQDVGRKTCWQGTGIRCVSSIQNGPIWASAHTSGSADKIVIWDVTTMSVLDVIDTDGRVCSVSWGSPSLCIFATNHSVSCWNVKTGSLVWSVKQRVGVHSGPLGCFAWKKQQVFEFDVTTGALLKSWRFSKRVDDLVCVATRCGKGKILVARTEDGFSLMAPSFAADKPVQPSSSPTPFSKFSAMEEPESRKTVRFPLSHSPNALRLLDAPCHALPPLAHIAPIFISSCLAPPAKA